METQPPFRFELGAFSCTVFNDGADLRPLDRVVANAGQAAVVQALQDLGFPTDLVRAEFDCLLIETGIDRVLVDTGLGVGSDPRGGRLLAQLASAGLTPLEIDAVIVTHGDRDHIGGLLDERGDPVFVHARHFIWDSAWTYWTDDQILSRMPAAVAAYGRVTLPRIQAQTTTVSANTEFLPGFCLIPAVGHRADHVAVSIRSGDAELLHVADAIHHPVMVIHPEWCSPFDADPTTAVATRRRLLAQAADAHALVFGAHIPFPGLGYVSRLGNGWQWHQVIR